ncbi:MAG: HEPN domain-containing protein [Deltaproteobacteria bacterium]|nr:HEPN domain-containing protein [Deltaproteobacteria bacterium]
MNAQNKTINMKLEMEKGRSALRQATILHQNNEYDGAVSRAYYAVLHFARALLFSKGLETNSHEGTKRLFSLHFVREGSFEKKYSTILSHAQKAREESDYEPEIPFNEEESAARIEEAKTFLKKTESHLKI